MKPKMHLWIHVEPHMLANGLATMTSHHATLTQGFDIPMGSVVKDSKPYPLISLHKLPIAPARALMLFVWGN